MKELNYDWLDEAWKPALTTNHSLNQNGGTDNISYFAGFSYLSQDGNLATVGYQRWNYRAGIDWNMVPRLKVSVQLMGNQGTKRTTLNRPNSKNDLELEEKDIVESRDEDYRSLLGVPPYVPSYINEFPVMPQIPDLWLLPDDYNYFAQKNAGGVLKSEPYDIRVI